MKILFGSDVSFRCRDGGITPENAAERVRSVKPVFDGADFCMVNLENVLYDSTAGEIIKSGPALRSSRHCVAFLKALGVDAVGLANNHFGDFGEAGMRSTWECLRENDIAWAGAGETLDDAYRALRFEKDGIRVAVIAACENEFGTATATTPGSAGYAPLRLADRIAEEKKTAEYVVVYFHGGNENNPFPSPKKNDWYRLWTRLGADAVIAMHTHCPQGYEIYEGKLIVYSMGNFYFPTEPEAYAAAPDSAWYYGYMTELEFTTAGITMQLHPYHFGSVDEPLTLLTGGAKARFDRYLDALCRPITDRGELLRLFKIWCTIIGPHYAGMLAFRPEMLEGDAEAVKRLRNVLCCEAHHELIATLMEMGYRNEIDTYRALQAEIRDWQNIR